MKHGIKLVTFIFLFSIILDSFLLAEDRIITSPLINLDEIKPSYEEQDTKNENISLNNELKNGKNENQFKKSQVVLIVRELFKRLIYRIMSQTALNVRDKIKRVVKMIIQLIMAICRLKILQNENEKVFIFNIDFSSDPNLTPLIMYLRFTTLSCNV